MGLEVSIDYTKVPIEWLEVFKKMKFSRSEIKKIHEIFDKLDVKQKGGLDIVEWLTFLDLERNKFTERVFCAFDKDGNRVIDFYEFVISLWKFCTLGEGAINVFAFDLYDRNADGILEPKEVNLLFRELLGSRQFESEANKAGMAELTSLTESGSVSIDDFRAYCKIHQALLAQVFHIQARMRMMVLGDRFWVTFAARRIELRTGYNVPISSLMTLHSDRALFKSLLEDRTIMRISSKMKIVLENTDNSLHYRTPESSLDSADEAAARMILVKPVSAKRGKGKKVHPKAALPADIMHYHRFPY